MKFKEYLLEAKNNRAILKILEDFSKKRIQFNKMLDLLSKELNLTSNGEKALEKELRQSEDGIAMGDKKELKEISLFLLHSSF
jgi:hypothetical protein